MTNMEPMTNLPECFDVTRAWQPNDAAWLDDLVATVPWQSERVRMFGKSLAIPRLTGAPFNTCLANYYRDGSDSVSWHADDEPELGANPVIASVSLGAARKFAIRNATDGGRSAGKRDTWSTDLGGGDLLVMRGDSQSRYHHSVPKTSRPIGARINLTFRVTL